MQISKKPWPQDCFRAQNDFSTECWNKTPWLSQALKPVLRSKGFSWVDSEPFRVGHLVFQQQHGECFRWWCVRHMRWNETTTKDLLWQQTEVNEWSHAGRSLSVLPQDWWWSVLKPDQLNFQICLRLIFCDSLIACFPTFFRLVCQGYPGAKGNFERSRREKWQDTYRHKIWKSRVCNLTNTVTGTLGWQKARDCFYWWSLHARTRYHQAGPWDANVWSTSTSSVAAGILN